MKCYSLLLYINKKVWWRARAFDLRTKLNMIHFYRNALIIHKNDHNNVIFFERHHYPRILLLVLYLDDSITGALQCWFSFFFLHDSIVYSSSLSLKLII
jgi:hypothetical protein